MEKQAKHTEQMEWDEFKVVGKDQEAGRVLLDIDTDALNVLMQNKEFNPHDSIVFRRGSVFDINERLERLRKLDSLLDVASDLVELEEEPE